MEKIFFFPHSRALSHTHTALITTTVAQRFGAAVARWAHNPKAPGSKPGIAIQREKKYFFVAANQLTARVAQSVEHWSNKPTVAGSIPVVSTKIIFYPTSIRRRRRRGTSSIGRARR